MRRLILLLILCLLGSPVKAAEQARGFGTTYGVASTDRIQSALTSHATQRTYAAWTYARAASINGSIFDKSDAGVQFERVQESADGSFTYQYRRQWTGGLAVWGAPWPATGAWVHVVVTYDSSNTSSVPEIYYNGISQSVSVIVPALGAASTNTDSYWIGNRGGGDRGWDGMLSQVAIWDRILTPTEIANLGTSAGGYNGWAPSCYATSLVEYIKLNDQPVTSSVLSNPTVTGTAQQTGLTIDYACGAAPSTVIGGRRIIP